MIAVFVFQEISDHMRHVVDRTGDIASFAKYSHGFRKVCPTILEKSNGATQNIDYFEKKICDTLTSPRYSDANCNAVNILKARRSDVQIVTTGFDSQYGENLFSPQLNAGVDHPNKAVGKRVSGNASPDQPVGILDTRYGHSSDPVDDSLRAWRLYQTEVIAQNTKDSGYGSKSNVTFVEKQKDYENKIRLAAHSRCLFLVLSVI